jgi:hypothetical protein
MRFPNRLWIILIATVAGGLLGYHARLRQADAADRGPTAAAPAATAISTAPPAVDAPLADLPPAPPAQPPTLREIMERIDRIQDPAARNKAYDDLMAGIGPDQIDAWLQGIKGIHDFRLHGLAALLLYMRWREFDAPGAMQYLQQANRNLQDFMIMGTFDDFLRKKQDPMACWTWLDQLEPDSQLWARAREQLALQWAGRDFAAAATHLLALPETERRAKDLIYLTALRMRADGPAAGQDWFTQVQQEHPGRGAEVLDALVHMWSHKAPADTLPWLLRQDAASAELIALATERWTRQDPIAVEQYLAHLPEGADKSAAQAAYYTTQAHKLAGTSPESALAWVDGIADPAIRHQLRIEVAQAWNARDPVAVDRWLDEQDFTLDEAQAILRFTADDLQRRNTASQGGHVEVDYYGYRYP